MKARWWHLLLASVPKAVSPFVLPRASPHAVAAQLTTRRMAESGQRPKHGQKQGGEKREEEVRGQPVTPRQARTMDFLKKRGIVGKNAKNRVVSPGVSEDGRTEGERREFAKDQAARGREVLSSALWQFGVEEREEKRALKRKILEGGSEALTADERARLQDLKAAARQQRVDELKAKGPIMIKTRLAFSPCNATGVIDRIKEEWPQSTSGTKWVVSTDRVMGGVSTADALRTSILGAGELEPRLCNLLRGKCRTAQGGGFVQLSVPLSNLLPEGSGVVDCAAFSGVELDVFCPRGERYNCHLRSETCTAPFSAYRATFRTKALQFTTVRLPWSAFVGFGPGAEDEPLDVSRLTRVGLLGFGRDFEVELALAGIRLYNDGDKVGSLESSGGGHEGPALP